MKKVIVITGGSDGLGKTLTEGFSKENEVIILATTEEKLKQVATDNNCSYKVCDVRNYDEVSRCINEIINEYNKIDVLINDAGLWIQDSLESNDCEKIKDVIEVNLLGVINCTKAVLPFMKEKKEGLIININSQAGLNYKAERAVYNASKWGVTGFSKCLAVEADKYGVRITDVMPGMMKTDMFNKMNIKKKLENGIDTKEVARLIKFIIDSPKDVVIPEVVIRSINN